MSINNVKSVNQTLSLHLIGNDSTKNFSREGSFSDWSKNDQKFRELIYSMANNGWLKNESIHIMPIESESDYAEEIAKRIAYYTDLAIKPFNIPTNEYVENDDGEVKPVIEAMEISNSQLIESYKAVVKGAKPKYRQLDGYRRLLAVPFANAIRLAKGLEPISEIPVVKFDRELDVNEQLQLCVQENTLGNLGGQAISDIDRLCICRNMVQIGNFTGCSTEAKLTKLYGDGGIGRTIRQKLANIIDLDALYPMANLFKVLRESENDALRYLDKEIMRPMYKEPRTGLDKDGNPWEPATIEDVLKYFLNPKAHAKATKVKAVSGAIMKEGGSKSTVNAFKELLEGGSKGNIDSTIQKYNDCGILINTAIEIIMEGDFNNPVMVALNTYAEEQHAILMASVSEDNEETTEETTED